MYKTHFGLNCQPFGLTPDTRFFYELTTHSEALNVLLVALENGEGFIKITGDVGTGKTMLCRKLLNDLTDPFITAYIPNPHLSPVGLLTAIADELGIAFSASSEQNRLLNDLNKFLISLAAQGKKLVLIIDEAQAMTIETLEALRLISNLETEQQKLLQIVLFGQIELDALLQNRDIRQLRQRITFSYTLKPLSRDEINDYIKYRLRIAGLGNVAIFSSLAIGSIHHYSKGIPRLINILAHKAMLSAFGRGDSRIGVKHIHLAAIDTCDAGNQFHVLGCHWIYLFLLVATIAVLFL